MVSVSHMNMDAVLKHGCRPLTLKARCTRAESNGRTSPGVNLVWHRVLSYGYARVQFSAGRSKVI